jgi:tetratricopeptide (TPR) repeat protein
MRFVFPYRRETIPVLEWAAEHDDDWRWTYLLALNLWARDRADEAASLLERMGDRPDFAPLYAARGLLLAERAGRDPEPDLRRAVQLDGTDRTLRIHLVRHLQRRGRWADALSASVAARTQFPGDFNLDLLHVRSLLHLGRPREAVAILQETRVLPSENARDSHRLWEQAHTHAALDALQAGANDAAAGHLRAALQWPEHLGQGRPYEPEERLARYLLGVAERRRGSADTAEASFDAVISVTDLATDSPNRLDLLSIPALAALGRMEALEATWTSPTTDAGRFGRALIAAIGNGDDVASAAARLAQRYAALFDDLNGRLILRALMASP